MKKHYTPKHLISIIKRHLPRKYYRVLEPSVGDGSLLLSIPEHRRIECELVAVDIHDKALATVEENYRGAFKKSNFINEDFLSWSEIEDLDRVGLFDFILMNPPFLAKKSCWVDYKEKKVPIEVAFLRAAMNLCSSSGTLIAILPQSVVTSSLPCAVSLRRDLFDEFDIRYCYELMEFEFPSIEGRFYIIVAKRGKRSTSVCIKSYCGGELLLKRQFLEESQFRMDYLYLSNKLKIETVKENINFNTYELSRLASVYRGKVSAPFDKERVIHTTSYNEGWNILLPIIYAGKSNHSFVQKNDILVKRIGRRCVYSFGLYTIDRKQEVSDCILIIRPNDGVSALKILFALRVIYSSLLGEGYLQQGTGAKFISSENLLKTPVIYNLNEHFLIEYRRWCDALLHRNIDALCELESQVRDHVVEKIRFNALDLEKSI